MSQKKRNESMKITDIFLKLIFTGTLGIIFVCQWIQIGN